MISREVGGELPGDLADFGINIGFTKRLVGVFEIVIKVLFTIQSKGVKRQYLSDQGLLKVRLKDCQGVSRSLGIGFIDRVDCRPIFVPHGVMRCGRMGEQMDMDDHLQRDSLMVKLELDGF